MDEIILIGAGGHANACIDVIEFSGMFKIAGFIEKNKNYNEKKLKYPILGSDDDLPNLRRKYKNAFITIGQIKTPSIRIKLYNILRELNFNIPIIKSPLAYVSNTAVIRKGTIIMHNAIINSNSKVGKNCIINSRALIEHDVVIDDHCHISTGSIINGGVKVGEKSFIGSGVITKQGISIGNNCIIDAGITLKNNVKRKTKIIKYSE